MGSTIVDVKQRAAEIAKKALEEGKNTGSNLCINALFRKEFGLYEGALTSIKDIFKAEGNTKEADYILDKLNDAVYIFNKADIARSTGVLRGELIAYTVLGASAPGIELPDCT